MRSPRVLLVTQWFDPEPTFKGILFARELSRRGFEVEVLTGFPNYPGGKVYPGYRIRPVHRECIDGIRVTRVALYPSHSKSAIGRVLNYLSFAFSCMIYGLFAAKRPDVVYAYHPPLTVGIAAACIRFFRRVPVLYDVQDLWPDTLRATGMLRSERVLFLVGLVCDWVYRRVDRIAVLSPGFKAALVARGVPESKVEVIFNWADEGAVAPHPDDGSAGTSRGPEGFEVLFAGNIGKAQALDSAIEAAEILHSRGSAARFVFLGDGVDADRLRRRAQEAGIPNVAFLPRVPMSEVGRFLRTADALFVHLRRDPLFAITIPSKTQAYMAAGKPIIMCVEGDAAELVRRSGGGISAAPESAEGIADAVTRLVSMPKGDREAMGRRARQFYEAELSVSAGVDRFAKSLRELIDARSRKT